MGLAFGENPLDLVITDAAGNEQTFARAITRDAAPQVASPLGDRELDEDDPALTIDLATVFSDADSGQGDTLTFTATSNNPQLIAVSISGTTLTATPGAEQSGTAVLTVRATDSWGLSVEDTLDVQIAEVNDAPVVTAPAAVTVAAESETNIPGVSVSDVDLDDSGIIVSLRAGARDDSPGELTGLMTVTPVGSVTVIFGNVSQSDRISLGGGLQDINATLATLRYAPKEGVTGETLLTVIANDYGITGPDDVQEDEAVINITITDNDPPVANDDEFETTEDDPVTGNVLADNGNGEDTDPDGNGVQLAIANPGTLSTALGATVTLAANGDFTYNPVGSNTAQAMAAGQTRVDLFQYQVSDGISTSVGTVSVTLSGINDPPLAEDDDFDTDAASSITGNVLEDNGHGADVDVDSTLQVTTAGQLTSSLGATVALNANGNFTYNPLSSAILQALTGSEQRVDSFPYTIGDGSATSTATVSITVTAGENADPVALGDTAQVDGDSSGNVIDVLGNDQTETGETLTVATVGTPSAQGTVTIATGGSGVLYTPAAGFLGIESFAYQVSDGRGGTADALVTVQVTSGEAALDVEYGASLSIFVNGEKEADPPANVGVTTDGFTSPIHTHAADGQLHIHPINSQPRTEPSTLGDFFETWRTNAGQAANNPEAIFNENQILDNVVDENHVIRMFVNGVPNVQFENYVPEPEDQIVISYELVAEAGTPTLVPIEDVTVLAGAPLQVPLDGFDFEGDSLTFTATSSNSSRVSTLISQTNRSMRIHVEDFGVMTLELFDDRVPRVTGEMAGLAEEGEYDGVIFHRVIQNFMIQGGDPTGTGQGNPSIPDFDDQFHVDLQHTSEGILSMAKTSQDDTNSSQFFITAGPTRHLDFNHSVFGRLVEGENVRRAIAGVETDDDDRPLTPVVMEQVEILVDEENGVLTLKAPAGATGQAEITVTVDDGQGGTLSRTFTVTVQEDTSNGGPFLEDFPEIRTTVDTPVEIQVRAVDVEGDDVTFDAAAGDVDFEFVLDDETGDAHTAVITVTPPAGFVGVLELGVAVFPASPSDTGTGSDPDVQYIDIHVDPLSAALHGGLE